MSIEMKILLTVVFCYFMLLADSFSMIMSFNSIIIFSYISYGYNFNTIIINYYQNSTPTFQYCGLSVHFLTDFNSLSQTHQMLLIP